VPNFKEFGIKVGHLIDVEMSIFNSNARHRFCMVYNLQFFFKSELETNGFNQKEKKKDQP
jgi:hypothetical protein